MDGLARQLQGSLEQELVLARGRLASPAVARPAFARQDADGPDCRLRALGEASVDFAVEYRVQGIDDGRNRYQSQVPFAIWNLCQAAGFAMPSAHRAVEVRGARLG